MSPDEIKRLVSISEEYHTEQLANEREHECAPSNETRRKIYTTSVKLMTLSRIWGELLYAERNKRQ